MISISDFLNLSPDIRKQLLKDLQQAHKNQSNSQLVKVKPDISCPFCNSKKFSHNGHGSSGKARFICKKCNRTFSETTGTPIHAIKKHEQFFMFLNTMSEGYQTLHKMAEITGVTISTAFQWRHKVLSAMNASLKKYDGITDFNTGVVPFSRKGLRKSNLDLNDSAIGANVLAVADYSNHSEITLLSIGTLKPVDFTKELKEKLRGNAIVIAPWQRQVAEFSKTGNLGFTLFRPEKQYNRFDVRHADKLHTAMDNYVRKRMKGVSTKYLQAYSEWIDRIAGIRKVKADFWNALLKNQAAWGRYVNREAIFSTFMRSRAETEYVRALNREWKTAEKYAIN